MLGRSPQQEELYKRVLTLGRLSTTSLDELQTQLVWELLGSACLHFSVVGFQQCMTIPSCLCRRWRSKLRPFPTYRASTVPVEVMLLLLR